MVVRILLVAIVLLLSGCRSDSVSLDYQYEEGSELNYELVATAKSSWDIAGRGEGSYRVTFDVTEVVESSDDDEAVINISLTPTDVVERGLPSPGNSPRSFTLLVGSNGEVLEVLAVDDIPAESLDPESLLGAMKAGHYYASTGATIRNVEITESEIIVETDPAIGIMLGGAGTARQYVRGDGLTRAAFSRSMFEPRFFRVIVVQADGKKAWTSPIWLDEVS